MERVRETGPAIGRGTRTCTRHAAVRSRRARRVGSRGRRLDADHRAQRRRAHARPAARTHPTCGAGRSRARCGRCTTVLPAVTCTVQSTLAHGPAAARHGIVGNGWYFRDLAEVWLWRQSNQLVAARRSGRRRARATRPSPAPSSSGGTTCTPSVDCRGDAAADLPRRRPQAARHLHPPGRAARRSCRRQLGPFPLFQLLGPGRRHRVQRLDRRRALHVLAAAQRPTLTLVYLPHLDYDLQRFGPASPGASRRRSREVDALCGRLHRRGARSWARTSSCCPSTASPRCRAPVHINRALREAGWLGVRRNSGREHARRRRLRAFAVADHQVAHVYVARPERSPEVAACLAALPGVERVLDAAGKRAAGLDHPRSGELVASPSPTLVHLLLLARRRARAGLRAHRRHPPQARLRPGRAVRRPGAALPEARAWRRGWRRRRSAALPDGRHPARRDAGARLARPAHRPRRGRPAVHHHGARTAGGDGPVPATAVKQLLLDHVFGAAP